MDWESKGRSHFYFSDESKEKRFEQTTITTLDQTSNYGIKMFATAVV